MSKGRWCLLIFIGSLASPAVNDWSGCHYASSEGAIPTSRCRQKPLSAFYYAKPYLLGVKFLEEKLKGQGLDRAIDP